MYIQVFFYITNYGGGMIFVFSFVGWLYLDEIVCSYKYIMVNTVLFYTTGTH